MSSYGQTGRTFKVRVDLDLPEESFNRINQAIHRAVLMELASEDVANGYSVALRPPPDDRAASASARLADSDNGDGFPPEIDPLGSITPDGMWIREEQTFPM